MELRIRTVFFALLVILTGCDYPAEGQGILNPYVFNNIDETPAGEQLFWGIGDSNLDGRGVTPPTIASGTMYNWNAGTSSFDNITNQSITNDGSYGSVYQYFAEAYKATTGKTVLVCNTGKGGSSFYPNAPGEQHWTGNGDADDLYVPALAKVRNALAAKGLTRPKAIFLNCGINDYTASTSEANITAAMNALLSNLNRDFPGVPILMLISGRTGSIAFDTGLYNLRKLQVAAAEANPDLYVVGSACQFIGAGYLNTGGDEIHYASNGLDWWGDMLNHWFINSSYTNEWARAAVSCTFDDLSSTRKGLINTLITGLYNRGDLFKLEHLSIFKTTVVNNSYIDFSWLGYNFSTSSTFTANTSISTNGTSSYRTITYFSGVNIRAASQNDFLVGAKIKTRTTAAGTTAIAFGGTDGTNAINFGQSTTATTYRCNDNTTTTGGEASITANNLYTIGRNGTTKELYKGSTLQSSTTQSSTGSYNSFIRIGCNQNSGVAASFINATFEYAFASKNVGFDLANFYTDMEATITGW